MALPPSRYISCSSIYSSCQPRACAANSMTSELSFLKWMLSIGSITIPSRTVIIFVGPHESKTRTGLQSEPPDKCYAEMSDGIVPQTQMHPQKSSTDYVMLQAKVQLVTK